MLFELGCWVMRGFNVGIPAHVAPSDWQPLSERWSDVRARVDLGQIHEIEVDYSIAPDWMEGAIAIALDPVSSEPIYHALDGDALYLEMGPREGGERLYMRLPLEGARSAYRRARDLCLESDPALHFVAPERIHVEIDLD
ncbi:hypothetical protein J2T57_001526 [Natronocella acetinitrilica]|uniref:Uncharacterized protein n=1 Tax=Natronocella acetinitrilica TaxID=414046 RepID=A0AAE3G2H3_9GAMM|nr:hypothetical protein [Natronocella acetinitrilica]MCP1674424.1 hypothetical protein [Natronocella acetinitrilica]